MNKGTYFFLVSTLSSVSYPSIFLSANLPSSHPLIFPTSHPHTFSPSNLSILLFPSSHYPMLPSSQPSVLSSLVLHVFISTYLYIYFPSFHAHHPLMPPQSTSAYTMYVHVLLSLISNPPPSRLSTFLLISSPLLTLPSSHLPILPDSHLLSTVVRGRVLKYEK